MTKQIAVLLLAFLCPTWLTSEQQPSTNQSSPSKSQPPAPHPLTVKRNADGNLVLEDGTPLRLRLSRNLSSGDTKTGDRVDFEVLDELKLGDTVVVQQDAIAWATVTEAQHKKSMGRAGKLDVNIDAVKMANGEKANLRAEKEVKGGGHVGAMTGAMVATSIVFFPAAPLFLFMHGKDVTIPKGTEIMAYVNGDTVFIAPPAASLANTKAEAPVVNSAELSISSTPDNADIEIDGSFAGDTPSVLPVGTGDHTVTIKKTGYVTWEKKIHVSGGHVNIKAELEKAQ